MDKHKCCPYCGQEYVVTVLIEHLFFRSSNNWLYVKEIRSLVKDRLDVPDKVVSNALACLVRYDRIKRISYGKYAKV